ncbi:hypothetical protein [Micromonospora maris]|uniref:Uncharacterized protein n=1 Tax=Micromonospora maris TaxID=1003110 RepID=A0A9X0I6Q9_9ACTN|nr:hypothetical protein [Micromonospora maris]AEB42656.1 hypothetical protein VAB18032_07680 [Micromonospora maris AB-18-032]KUJ48095.1 hypothetical protein ADL17_03160 [Micromonospora maris]
MGSDELLDAEQVALMWLRHALGDLYVHDWALLRHRVGERALTARLAHHLVSHVDPSWHVDAEYDRQGTDGAMKVRDKARRTRMQPDLVVHRRGLRGSENNRLFVEVKRRWQQPGGDADDIDKVRQAVTEHRYQVAAAVGIGTTGRGFSPVWTVYIPSRRPQSGTRRKATLVTWTEAVFDEAELVALEVAARQAGAY